MLVAAAAAVGCGGLSECELLQQADQGPSSSREALQQLCRLYCCCLC
jgi:hypothetical protein